jgi:protein-disulfide isomerase
VFYEVNETMGGPLGTTRLVTCALSWVLITGCRGHDRAPAASRPAPTAPASRAAATAAPTTAPPEVSIDLSRAPSTGSRNAPIEVVVYSDFLCPHCRAWGGAFHDFLPRVADRLSLHYKFYPLDACNPAFADRPMHPGACWLAFGGVCADEQGKFWEYHDRVFASGTSGTVPDRASVAALGTAIGADARLFEGCLDSPRPRERVSFDIAEAAGLGVTGTPTVFVNKRRLARLTDTEPTIEAESQRLGLGPVPAAP